MKEQEKSNVSCCIQRVVSRFRANPNIFLTEDDVRFHLCHELMSHFNEIENTEDGDTSISLHSEVRWYGNDGSLKIRSDIVIIDVSSLKVLNSLRIPSKGYGFNIPKGIIEIKFRRPNGPSNNKWKSDVEKDIQKLEDLAPIFEADGERPSLWVVAFDKKSVTPPQIRSSELVEIITENSNQPRTRPSRGIPTRSALRNPSR